MESFLTLSTVSGGGRQVEPAQTVVGRWEGRSPDLWAAPDFEHFYTFAPTTSEEQDGSSNNLYNLRGGFGLKTAASSCSGFVKQPIIIFKRKSSRKMYKETKQTVASTPSAGYVSPSVRVIALRTRSTILGASDPVETSEDQSVF